MIYICQITNKKNGMSYIGQEKFMGNCLMGQMDSDSLLGKAIEADGVENFISQILVGVEENEASLWEDYYIM